MQTTQERQNELQKNYYFLCQCKRCATNHEQNFVNAMICSNVECQAAIPMKNKQKEASMNLAVRSFSGNLWQCKIFQIKNEIEFFNIR